MLKGNLCTLRHMQAQDLDRYLQLANNLEIRGQYFPLLLKPPEAVKKEFYETGFVTDEMERMLILDQDDQIVGDIGNFKVRSKHTREIGFILFEPEARGRGYTSEATRLLSDYLFRAYHHIQRLELIMATENKGSERVAQKCGFTREGVMRQQLFMNGRYHDSYLYSLLRSDWEANRK